MNGKISANRKQANLPIKASNIDSLLVLLTCVIPEVVNVSSEPFSHQ